MTKGFVYILTNRSMPGLIKVGKTTRDVVARATELFQTGVPVPFDVAFTVATPDCDELERACHRTLSSHRVSPDREFFAISVEDAIGHVAEAHRRQVVSWVAEFLPDASVCDPSRIVSEDAIARLSTDVGCKPEELASALHHALDKDLASQAMATWRAHLSAVAGRVVGLK